VPNGEALVLRSDRDSSGHFDVDLHGTTLLADGPGLLAASSYHILNEDIPKEYLDGPYLLAPDWPGIYCTD
jgi:hypothetical protein